MTFKSEHCKKKRVLRAHVQMCLPRVSVYRQQTEKCFVFRPSSLPRLPRGPPSLHQASALTPFHPGPEATVAPSQVHTHGKEPSAWARALLLVKEEVAILTLPAGSRKERNQRSSAASDPQDPTVPLTQERAPASPRTLATSPTTAEAITLGRNPTPAGLLSLTERRPQLSLKQI